MGLTSALNTSLNGLTLNETTIDVLGNNIANAGTNGFKASNVLFTTQLSRTFNVGSRPTETNGGTNPHQVGLGATTSAISKDFSQGSVTNSTSPSDLAIQGEGFFILESNMGDVYTRNGNFSLNSEGVLVNAQGLRVQGYGVDENFELVTTQLDDINIPLGDLNIAQQTKNVTLGGALLPTGELATNGTELLSEALTDAGNAGAAIIDTTLLTDVRNGAGDTLFTDGETLSFTPSKGGRKLDTTSFPVSATSTVAEFLAFVDSTLGIQSGGDIPDDGNGGQPRVALTAGGEIEIVGNTGTVNEIAVSVGDLLSDGATVPLSFTQNEVAVGESTITNFIVYDSLGEPIELVMTGVLESRDSMTTTFRYFIDSADDSDLDIAVGNGTIVFDSNGNVLDNAMGQISIQRENTAAVSPMQVNLDFSNVSGISSADAGSALTLQLQDGSSAGSLTNFVIDEMGTVNGVFDNGIIRTLGQVTLARFPNAQGLLENGNGTYREGVSSGPSFVVAPGNFGLGTLRAGAIEQSNTDIGRNLVELIVASTNYRGNARVISSIQQLVDELLVLGR